MNNSPRNTFGIIDKQTGKPYTDILSSHLQLRRLLVEEWLIERKIAESKDRQKSYTVLLDFTTQRQLLRDGIADVLISFQHRKDGCYAICRLWDPEKATGKTLVNTDIEQEYYNHEQA